MLYTANIGFLKEVFYISLKAFLPFSLFINFEMISGNLIDKVYIYVHQK